MAEVIWSRRALADVAAITSYIRQFSPLAAQRIAARLYQAGDSLEDVPDRGRSLGRRQRELTIVAPYIIRYIVRKNVVILTVRHGARRPAS